MDEQYLQQQAGRLAFRWPRPGVLATPGTGRALMRGQGLEFVGYRDYRYGDDVRAVDWNVAARLGHPLVKVFDEGVASALVLVVDGSGSMQADDGDRWRAAADLATLLGLAAARDGDRVGGLVVAGTVAAEFSDGFGPAHARAWGRWLTRLVPSGGDTRLDVGIERAQRRLRRPGTIVVVSDFLSESWIDVLGRAARQHVVIALRVVHRVDTALEDVGVLPVVDAESGRRHWVDTSDPHVRRAFAEQAVARSEGLRTAFRRAGAIAVDVESWRPLVPQLHAICHVDGH